MRTRDRAWSAYASSICHYCGSKAKTEDHIVPRCLLPKPMSRQPYWFRAFNVVPACVACNNWKSDYRSDCACDACTWAWDTAKGLYAVPDVPVRIVLRSPALN